MKALAIVVAAIAWLSPGVALAVCQVDVRPVTFGDLDLVRDTYGKGLVVVTCDRQANFTIAIVGGAERTLRGPSGHRLRYRVFTDPTHRVPWGDGGRSGQTVRASNDGYRPTRLTIYGAIPPQPGVAVGDYADHLQVALRY